MKKSFAALGFGTLGLGISEYMMMGILSDAAGDLNISIPRAGRLISAYALGTAGGIPISMGGYVYSVLPGTGFAFLGFLVLVFFFKRYRRSFI
jgi:predicted MFS family arabinose efflux permease